MQTVVCILLITMLAPVMTSQAAGVLGPPHQDVTSPSIMACIDCHDVTAIDVPKLMPKPPGWVVRSTAVLENELTVFNLKCWDCHNGSTPVTAGEPPVTRTLNSMQTHSSLTSGSTKYGNWAVGCTICHNPHGQAQPGGKLVQDSIDLGKIEVYGSKTAKTGDKTVIFNGQTGPNSFADGDSVYNGICEVCHTETKYHRNSADGDHSHYSGQNCMGCHNHTAGFIHGGSSDTCIQCHGHDAGYEYSTGNFSQGVGTFASHSAHTEHDADDVNGPNLACSGCHDINNFPLFADGQDLAATTVCDRCHNDATGIATGSTVIKSPPAWNTASLNCNGCHATGPSYASGTPKANSHGVHAGFGCANCHSATTPDGTSIADPTLHPDGSYTLLPGTGVDFSYAFNPGGGTCSNISCHGGGNAVWGTVLTMGCDSCHGYPPVSGDGKNINQQFDMGKGFHVTSLDASDPVGMGGHIIYPAILKPLTDKYGDKTTGYNECFKCHENGIHANGTVEVQITDSAWSGPMPKGSGTYDRPYGLGFGGLPHYSGIPGDIVTAKTCSNIICHQGQTTPDWSCPGGE